MQQYYYQLNGERLGPVSADGLVARGVDDSTLVWCEGMADWKPANEVDELKSLFSPAEDKKKKKKKLESCPHEWVGESKFMIGLSIALIVYYIADYLLTESLPIILILLAAAMIIPLVIAVLALKKAKKVNEVYVNSASGVAEADNVAKQANLLVQLSFFAAAIIFSAYWLFIMILPYAD